MHDQRWPIHRRVSVAVFVSWWLPCRNCLLLFFVQPSSQRASGSHSTAGKPNTATIVPAFTKPSSLGLDNHSHRLTLRGAFQSYTGEGATCRRQAATCKLATHHNACVHMNVHHAANTPSGTVTHGLALQLHFLPEMSLARVGLILRKANDRQASQTP
jgi:hypothetical protein